MGCDGGTIPRRDELVRVKKKPEQVRLQSLTSLGEVRFFIGITDSIFHIYRFILIAFSTAFVR